MPIIEGVFRSDRQVHRTQRHQDVFLLLLHPPEEAEVDFGFADVGPGGELTKGASFGGVPMRISDHHSKITVSSITGSRERKVTREFQRLKSHFLFVDYSCPVR